MWNTLIFLVFILFSLDTPHSMTYAATVNTDDVTLYCYDGSAETFYIFSLDNPLPLLNSSCYDPAKKIVFLVFGFTGTPNDPYVYAMVEAHLFLSYNVVLFNWEKQAAGGLVVAIAYIRAARNAVIHGTRCGVAIAQLVRAGLDILKIVLIGFSLGAHFMGYVAREVRRILTQSILRVIGLDPAGPLFDGLVTFRPLTAASAIFVLFLLTNPGGMGTTQRAGTVNFVANCGRTVQPGCENATGDGILYMSPPNRCSHMRSWILYVEVLRSLSIIIGTSTAGETLSLRDHMPLSASGTYFFRTNAAPIFGKGLEGASCP